VVFSGDCRSAPATFPSSVDNKVLRTIERNPPVQGSRESLGCRLRVPKYSSRLLLRERVEQLCDY
jgi:hypothetical protein